MSPRARRTFALPRGIANVVLFAALAALAALAAPARSHAFYDCTDFAAPAEAGGGGGRFFTGSPADGQTCSTCHSGGQPPSVNVAGLPARYVPGATYEISVTWPAYVGDVGALLEVTDQHGKGAGTLALPPSGAVRDEELCEPRSQHVLAARLFEAPEGRVIAGVSGCGAASARVQWTAPKTNVGLVWLAGAVVSSDQEGDVEGDGVTNFVQSTPPFGANSASSMQDGCSASPGTRSTGLPVSIGALALCFLLARRRSSQQRWRRLWLCVTACFLASCAGESLLDPGRPRSMGPVTLQSGSAVDAWDAGQPPLDSGSTREPPADAGVDAQAPRPPRFQFRVTTLPLGGAFAPKNAGAIWVQDASGAWVKTLSLWATSTLRYLSHYVQANRNGNTVDAITSATVSGREEHVITWSLSDLTGATIPDGTYHVLVEVTDRNGPGELLDLEFVKGATPWTVTPSDTPYFQDVQLIYGGE